MKTHYLLLPLMFCVITSAYAADKAKDIVLPVVNDENCKTENIKKIKDKEAQEAFAGLCIRRGDFVKSPPKAW